MDDAANARTTNRWHWRCTARSHCIERQSQPRGVARGRRQRGVPPPSRFENITECIGKVEIGSGFITVLIENGKIHPPLRIFWLLTSHNCDMKSSSCYCRRSNSKESNRTLAITVGTDQRSNGTDSNDVTAGIANSFVPCRFFANNNCPTALIALTATLTSMEPSTPTNTKRIF